MKKTIVVSAVNLRKGGTLTILRNCLEYLSTLAQTGDYRIVALVHKKELAFYPGIEYIEMPWTIRNWLLRLWCEYVTMYRISKQLSPVYLWFSLHDSTPNVKAQKRAVYCHNPFPFYQWKWRELFLNYKIVCFAWFSKYIYRINIHKNQWILVQQEWIREAFLRMFRLNPKQIIVTLPASASTYCSSETFQKQHSAYHFLFASYGDIHKNFETVCRAAKLLEKEIGTDKFKVILTISGTENRYARWLYKRWGNVRSIDFAGFMSKEKLYDTYAGTDCLLFPSRVETWGLPISEFAAFGKPMLLADLPYAHETAAGSGRTAFFNPEKPEELKEQMKRLVEGDTLFLKALPETDIPQPVTRTWEELFKLLCGEASSVF